jgi:histidinol-phosphate aminotransferase
MPTGTIFGPMGLSVLDVCGLESDALERALPKPSAAPGGPGGDERTRETEVLVAGIIDRVRRDGDRALFALTEELDKVQLSGLTVGATEIDESVGEIPGSLTGSLVTAWKRLLAYHRHQAGDDPATFSDGTVRIDELVRPVRRAGLYAPGGLALYPSSVLMCAAPAVVAGVDELALCVPPGPDGKVARSVLAAAAIAGISEVHPVGGAQAIAAMAFGTESIPRVDVVVGPGNRFVAEAKRQVFGSVGVAAAFAGPSEVVVVSDGSAPAAWTAVDLVVQAEHGPNGLAFLIAWDRSLVDEVCKSVDDLVDSSSRGAELSRTLETGGYAVVVDGPEQAMEVANLISPEHLELHVADPGSFVGSVRTAGEVFLGPWAPASVGDYVAGTNHVLPTARTARFASALRVDDFRTHIGVVALDPEGLARLAPHVTEIATSEGLIAHADSVRLRLRESWSAVPPASGVEDREVTLPSMRPGLAKMTGYHSPQVEVEVRLNTNESPFAPPQAWFEQLSSALSKVDFNRYPDRKASRLREAVAAHEGVAPDQVFCANGSNEVIQSLLLAYGGPGRTALVFEPTYALHSHIARITSTRVHAAWRSDGYLLDAETVDDALAGSSPVVTFLCSPNNPTGRSEPAGILEHVLSAAAESSGGLVVVDEAYGQFADTSAIAMIASGVQGAERLVVLRTFSKTWSMAGCRLGYMVADPEVVAACDAAALPYHLDAMTQVAGVLALEYEPEMRRRIESIVAERHRVADALAGLDLQTWPSDANFILFRPINRDAKEVWSDLLEQQILVRDCSGWPGLSGCLRVTIGTQEENTRFIEALGTSLSCTGAPR